MDIKILVADDVVSVRTELKNILNEGGYVIAGEASTGLEAIEKAKELKPEIVILDITMPEMDGVTALPEILRLSPGSKVIMCTALGQQTMVAEAKKNGAEDAICKPFQKERVLQTLDKVIAKK